MEIKYHTGHSSKFAFLIFALLRVHHFHLKLVKNTCKHVRKCHHHSQHSLNTLLNKRWDPVDPHSIIGFITELSAAAHYKMHFISCPVVTTRLRGRQNSGAARQYKWVIEDSLFILQEVNISWPASSDCPEDYFTVWVKTQWKSAKRLKQKITSAAAFSVSL